jgi:surfeit locus 1 family protein
MTFRPSPIPTVFVALGLIILLNLGAWQIRRNTGRKAHLASIEYRLEDAPTTNATFNALLTDDVLSWRKATLLGRFHDVEPIYLAGRFEFGEPGYDLIQPFELENGPSIMVVRGWIPSSDWRAVVQDIRPTNELVTLQGLLIEPLGDADAVIIPATDIAPQRLRRDSFEAARAQSEIETAPVGFVGGRQLEAGALKSRESYPVTGYVPKPKSLPHVQYAVTWFLIAGTLIVIWLLTGFRRGAALMAEPARP